MTQTLGPDKDSSNTFNTPVFLVPISPVDACQYVPENFSSNIESIFVPDAKKDMERAMATVERNIKREEELSKNVATDDLLLFGAATEMTTAGKFKFKFKGLFHYTVGILCHVDICLFLLPYSITSLA